MNFLKRLLDAGALSQDDLQQIPTNELRRLLMPGDAGGFVRNEDSGDTMVLNGQPGGAFDSVPVMPRQAQGFPDQVSRAMGQQEQQAPQQLAPQAMAPQSMQQQQPQQRIKMAGYGNGIMSDLGETTGPAPQIDMSRPAVETPKGKGYYGKDGGVYVRGPEGWTKIVLGYDRQASMEMNKADLARRTGEQGILHTQEQIEASRAARNQKEGIPGLGIPQSTLEKQYGKAPEGQQWTLDGKLVDVPGYNGKPLNETQGKAAGFATRAQAAHNILLGLEGQGVNTPGIIKQNAEGVPLVGGALGMAVNALPTWIGGPSSDQRKVEQAQRDFVNAVLRPESGASINPSEFENARKQYFPQPGDDDATKLQKQQAREREIAALGVMAGPAGVQAMGKTNASNASKLQGAEKSRAIFDAKKAIERGADPMKVKQRLLEAGVTDPGF